MPGFFITYIRGRFEKRMNTLEKMRKTVSERDDTHINEETSLLYALSILIDMHHRLFCLFQD